MHFINFVSYPYDKEMAEKGQEKFESIRLNQDSFSDLEKKESK